MPQVVLEGRPVDEVTLREAAARVALRSVIHDRTEEELTGEARLPEGGGGLTYDGGERRPRRVAAHPEAIGIEPEFGGVGSDPPGRREAIVDRGREGMLGGEAVIDGEQAAAAGGGERPADAVVCLETPGDESPTVKVDESR